MFLESIGCSNKINEIKPFFFLKWHFLQIFNLPTFEKHICTNVTSHLHTCKAMIYGAPISTRTSKIITHLSCNFIEKGLSPLFTWFFFNFVKCSRVDAFQLWYYQTSISHLPKIENWRRKETRKVHTFLIWLDQEIISFSASSLSFDVNTKIIFI